MTSENNTNFNDPVVLHSLLVVATLQQTSIQTSIQTKRKMESEQKKSTSLEGSRPHKTTHENHLHNLYSIFSYGLPECKIYKITLLLEYSTTRDICSSNTLHTYYM